MAKVTATDAGGNDVPVLQVQFNNLGQVESFLTQLPNGHQKWVFASEYTIEVDEAGEQPDLTPGVMTKTATLKPNETVKKMGLQDNTPPAEPEPVVDDTPLDDGIISEGDLNGPKPTEPILGAEAGPEPEPTTPPAAPATTMPEPTTPPSEPPVEPTTAPAVPEPTPPVAPKPAAPKPAKPTAPKPTKPAAK